jgi:hypothetical protein
MDQTAQNQGNEPAQNYSGPETVKQGHEIQAGTDFRKKEGQPQKNAFVIDPLPLPGRADHPLIGFDPRSVGRKHGFN